MLTNGFTREEMATCAAGASLTCIESVTMYKTGEVTFSVGQQYKVESIHETIMVVKNDQGRPHMMYGSFFRKHFALEKARPVVHLSETGLNAGRRLCGAARDDGNRSVHAMFAPLHATEFRENVCQACLAAWANEAYDEGDPMPEYIAEARKGHLADPAAGHAQASAPQLVLEMQ